MANDTPDYGGVTASPQILLGTIALTGGQAIPQTTFAIPAGAVALVLVTRFSSGSTLVDPTGGCTVFGTQTNYIFFAGTLQSQAPGSLTASFSAIFPLWTKTDTQVTVKSSPGGLVAGGFAGFLDVIALYDQAVVAVVNASRDEPLQVAASSPGATNGPTAPLAANILAGEVETNNADIITIPAGRTWVGSVWTTALAGAASSLVLVATTGATVTPNGVNVCTLDVGPNLGGSTTVPGVTVAAGASAATLRAETFGGVPARFSCGAAGVLY